MPSYLSKGREQILRHALQKLSENSAISATGPGSIARALVEVITDEIGDFYSTLDFNMSQTVLSTASGRALDMLGGLYNVQRKQLSDLATTEAQVGAFYFYIDAPHSQEITIPRGVRVSTAEDSQLGNTFVYVTTQEVVIPVGRVRAYVGIRPGFEDSIFTAGVGTLIEHNYADGPVGVLIKCTNAKPIAPQIGFELDDDYRVRIQKAVRTAAGGTLEAVRFTGLSVPGVRDIKIRTAPYGLGSFEVIVVSEEYSVAGTVTHIVDTTLQSVRPVGVRMLVTSPNLMHVDVSAAITMKTGPNISTTGVTRRVENAILRYLNTLLVGDDLIYNQMVSYILETAEVIADVTITRLAINGQEVLRKNYSPKDNEQLVPGNIEVTIA